MTAPILTPRIEDRTRALAREMGGAFRQQRTARGDRLSDIAESLGVSRGSVGRIGEFERGAMPNPTLGTVLRYLSLYGLTLTITRLPRPTMRIPE